MYYYVLIHLPIHHNKNPRKSENEAVISMKTKVYKKRRILIVRVCQAARFLKDTSTREAESKNLTSHTRNRAHTTIDWRVTPCRATGLTW
jgi:hypothetical protein